MIGHYGLGVGTPVIKMPYFYHIPVLPRFSGQVIPLRNWEY